MKTLLCLVCILCVLGLAISALLAMVGAIYFYALIGCICDFLLVLYE
jgi:hypothetical protein